MGKAYDQDASQNLADSFHCENGENEVVEFGALHFFFEGLVDDDGDGVEDESRSHACECEAGRTFNGSQLKPASACPSSSSDSLSSSG